MKTVNMMKVFKKPQWKSKDVGPFWLSAQCFNALCFSGLLGMGSVVHADTLDMSSNDAQLSLGASAGVLGIGVTVTGTTDWHVKSGDRIQWRAMISGMDLEVDDGDVELSDIEYEDTDYSITAMQLGLDWYPIASQGWTGDIFFSGGLMYVDSDFSANADMDKRFSVGSTTVNPGDIDALETEIESSGVLPYISLGWGNKITGEAGFDFMVELGLAYQLNDPDVKLVAVDPTGHLSAGDLDDEARDIEDEAGGVQAFGTITVAYHF